MFSYLRCVLVGTYSFNIVFHLIRQCLTSNGVFWSITFNVILLWSCFNLFFKFLLSVLFYIFPFFFLYGKIVYFSLLFNLLTGLFIIILCCVNYWKYTSLTFLSLYIYNITNMCYIILCFFTYRWETYNSMLSFLLSQPLHYCYHPFYWHIWNEPTQYDCFVKIINYISKIFKFLEGKHI